MELRVWAEDHAGQLLSSLRRRWSHARAVGTAAREVGRHLKARDAEVLLAAAYLHDIGYAPDLVETGFHQLDGARHLSTLGHGRLAGLVAHHTRAVHEARLRGLGQALSEFDDEDSIVSAALAYCDLTAGPQGEEMTPEQRPADVGARYGEDDPVTIGLRTAWPELIEDVAEVNALLEQRRVVAQPK